MVLAIIAHLVRGLDWRATGDLGARDTYTGDPPHPPVFTRAGTLVCQRCGVEDKPRIVLCAPGSVHAARGECAHCGAFLKWQSMKSEEQREAKHQKTRQYAPATNAQLHFLERLGYDGPPPMSIQEASDLIERRLAERAATTATRRKRWGIDD